MRIIDLQKRSLRSLLSAKARTLLTASAIAVGTFALTLTLAASNGAESYVGKIISDNFDPAELIVAKDAAVFGPSDTSAPQEFDPSFGASTSVAGANIQIKQITQEDIDQIKNLPKVENVREGVSLNITYLKGPRDKKYVGTIQAFNPAQRPQLAAGSIPQPFKNDQVLLPEAYVPFLGFVSPEEAIGQNITIAVSPKVVNDTGIVTEELQIAGVLKPLLTAQPGTELYLQVNNETALRLNDIVNENTSNYRKYQAVFVRVEGGENEETLESVQSQLTELGFVSQSVKETQDFLNQIIGVLRGIVAAFGMIAVIASVFGIINTMYISVIQRTREIGLMKALGMRNRDIGRLFRTEAALIGLIGGLLGSMLAIITGTLLNPVITEALELGEGNNLILFDTAQTAGLIGVLVLVSIFAGWLPSRKASKLDPIEALRTE